MSYGFRIIALMTVLAYFIWLNSDVKEQCHIE